MERQPCRLAIDRRVGLYATAARVRVRVVARAIFRALCVVVVGRSDLFLAVGCLGTSAYVLFSFLSCHPPIAHIPRDQDDAYPMVVRVVGFRRLARDLRRASRLVHFLLKRFACKRGVRP